MPDIHQLPRAVINKIAAGEVIERPASVVKELMENSVDAGATRIDVLVEIGGSQLIRVADNGCGISQQQLELAVASHATSKILDADDLFHVDTLGFRGEALASIAEISHFQLRSRIKEADAGAELEVVGGEKRPLVPCGTPSGTTIEVRNLFYNTPVRRKFLRTTQTEMGHVSEAFTRIALAHPQIHFSLKHNQKQLHDLPPVDHWSKRIEHFFGQELAENLFWVESEADGIKVSGYVANPTLSRSHNRMQYLFLNGRHIRDRSLQHALREAYRGLLLTGRQPIAFLRLDMPAEAVDVNVHPTKLEVRFRDSRQLYSQLLGAIRNMFLATDLTAQVDPVDTGQQGPETTMDPRRLSQHRQQLVDWTQGETSRLAPSSMDSRSQLDAVTASSAWRAGNSTELAAALGQSVMSGSQLTEGATAETQPQGTSLGMQLHNRYLVAEHESGIMVIDQHALHERVLYEQLREKIASDALEVQRLLVPEAVNLTAAEAAAVIESRDELATLGIEVEPFGGDTVLVVAYPAMLEKISPGEILRQVVEQLVAENRPPERRDLIDELLHSMACKAAVKAGDSLSLDEVISLLLQRHLCQDAHHCPHGRPTALVFTKEELDRRFKRI
jgi:DNA mismatch repair protein MutL